MTGYILMTAEADLRDIIRYTRKQWGDEQVRRYIATLDQGISTLAKGQGVFKDMGEIYPGLRMGRYNHHYVFCLLRGAEPALIVAHSP